MPRLRRSDPSRPGISRRRRGRGWSYAGPDGTFIRDPATVERLDALVIPPAWRDVWICPWPNGHIQAVGTDVAGRRQYRYHDDWRTRRDAEKFDRVLEVAERLPRLRERVAADLALPGMPRERTLACAARLLDIGFFRIGSEEYAEANQTFGLATMLREHVTVEDAVVTFDYTAKSGKHRVTALADPAVLEVVQALLDRDDPAAELLAWHDPGDDAEPARWVDMKSWDVNAYLHEASGGAELTAKDFRTWSATVLAAVGLAVSTQVSASPSARKRAITRMYREVSDYLGNTPAVCKASYIHPRVVDLYSDGVTVAPELEALGEDAVFGQLSTQGAIEAAVLDMLRDPRAARAAAKAERSRGAAVRSPRRPEVRAARAQAESGRRSARRVTPGAASVRDPRAPGGGTAPRDRRAG